MKRKDNTVGSDAPDDSKGEQPSVDALGDGADMDLEMTRITSELQEAVEAVRQSFVSASHAKEETITQAQAEADTVRAECCLTSSRRKAALEIVSFEADRLSSSVAPATA